MNTILLILCNALSCFIISTILFQFMNGKYKKSSQSRYVYIVIETVTVIFTTCINMLNHSILNLVVWGVLTGIIAYALYYEDMDKPLRRIIECEALVFCMSVCESLGAVSYTHLRAHETDSYLVCRLLLEKKNAVFCLKKKRIEITVCS